MCFSRIGPPVAPTVIGGSMPGLAGLVRMFVGQTSEQSQFRKSTWPLSTNFQKTGIGGLAPAVVKYIDLYINELTMIIGKGDGPAVGRQANRDMLGCWLDL
jgi:hypothetical protein